LVFICFICYSLNYSRLLFHLGGRATSCNVMFTRLESLQPGHLEAETLQKLSNVVIAVDPPLKTTTGISKSFIAVEMLFYVFHLQPSLQPCASIVLPETFLSSPGPLPASQTYVYKSSANVLAWHLVAARFNAVFPLGVVSSILALPFSKSSSHTSVWPL